MVLRKALGICLAALVLPAQALETYEELALGMAWVDVPERLVTDESGATVVSPAWDVLANQLHVEVGVEPFSWLGLGINMLWQNERSAETSDNTESGSDYPYEQFTHRGRYRSLNAGWRLRVQLPTAVAPYALAGQNCGASDLDLTDEQRRWHGHGCAFDWGAGVRFQSPQYPVALLLEYNQGHFADVAYHGFLAGFHGRF